MRASLLPACFRVLQGGVILWLILGLCYGAALLLELKGPFIEAVLRGLVVFSVYKLLHGFMVEATKQRDSGRPLLNLPPLLARHYYLTSHVILLYSAIFITLRGILTSFGSTGEMTWRVYEISLLALFIWFVAPKHLFLALLPPETRLRKFLRGCVHFAHPLIIALLAFVIVLNTIGYTTMSFTLVNTMIGCVIAVVSVAVVRKLITSLAIDRSTRKRRARGEEEVELRTTRRIVDYSSVIVSIIVITSLWVASYVAIVTIPSAPPSLRTLVTETGSILGHIYRVLIFRLEMGGEVHTTPLNIIIAIILIVIFFFVAALLKRFIDTKLIAKLQVEKGMSNTISSIVSYAIIAFSILFAMSIAGIPLRSLAFFAGALGVGIGFGMQHIVNNFLSGIILMFERPIAVGDFIYVGSDIKGTVQRIGPRSTTLQTPDNVYVVVPNSKLMDGNIQNQSMPTTNVRSKLSIGVAYGTEPDLVKKLLLRLADENSRVLKTPEPFVRFDAFGDSYYDFQLVYWCSNGGDRWHSMSEIRFAIEKLFAEHKIEIPFPQRDINIRSIPPEMGHAEMESNRDSVQEDKGGEKSS